MLERPVRDMLGKYMERDSARFHMPGHKGALSPWDVTELDVTDDLNNPGNAIIKAQELLSLSYGSNSSFFLCGGSTEGLKAMFRYLKLTGRSVIIPKSSHKNVFYACIDNQINPVLFDTHQDSVLGTLSYENQFMDMMDLYPEAGAIFITRPDYYGRCMNLKNIAQHARSKGMLVLCDSAHGAHFALSLSFPYDAAGLADIWVHSAHKTLGALTPSAYLHCSDSIDSDLMASILPSVRTSSPNYEIIMSMDDARAANFESNQGWEKRIHEINHLALQLDHIKGIMVFGKTWASRAGYEDKDDLRLVIDASAVGGGFHLKRQLENKNIFVEMADTRNIIAIMTPYDKPQWDDMLIDGIRNCKIAQFNNAALELSEHCRRVMSMHEAYFSGRRFVNLRDASGCVCAEIAGAYPPGTPVILPGEVINLSTVEYLSGIEQSGGSLFGISSNGIRVI